MKTKTYLLLIAISIVLNGSCSKDRERESFEVAITKTKVTFEINSFEEINPETLVVKSAITVFATQQEVTHYGLFYKEDQNFNFDPNIFHTKTYKPNGNTITIECSDTIKNLYPETEYFFKLVALIQPQPEGKDNRQYSTIYKYTTKKAPLQITGIIPNSGTYRDEITIKGKGFSKTLANNKVTFNGMGAVISKAFSDSIKVFVPKKAGTGNILVTLGNESANAGQFEYIHEPYVVYTLAGGADYGMVNGMANGARFYRPSGIVFDKEGNLIIADFANNMIRKLSPSGFVSTLAGVGNEGHLDGYASQAKFSKPMTLTLNPESGNIYITDRWLTFVRVLDKNGNVTTLAGSDTTGYRDGIGKYAKFKGINGIVRNTQGDLFVVDDGNNRIRKINLAGDVTTFAGNGSREIVEGLSVNASIGECAGITIDANDNLFVLRKDRSAVLKITPSAAVSVFTGNFHSESNLGVDLGHVGITIDKQNNLWITEISCIKKVAPDGTITTFAGLPSEVRQVNGGISVARFKSLSSITLDNMGNFYVTDDNCIRKIEKVE